MRHSDLRSAMVWVHHFHKKCRGRARDFLPRSAKCSSSHQGWAWAEAVGRQSALPVHRPGPAKKIFSMHTSPLVHFCLLESKERTFISNDGKNVETNLLCVEALPLLIREELKAHEKNLFPSSLRLLVKFLLAFTENDEFLPKTCPPPHTSVWVSGGNTE